METFTVSGTIRDTPYTVTWEDGRWDDASGLVSQAAAEGETYAFTPTGPWVKPADRPMLNALAAALAVFDTGTTQLSQQATDLLAIMHDEAAVPEGAEA